MLCSDLLVFCLTRKLKYSSRSNESAWNTQEIDLKIDPLFPSLQNDRNGSIKQWASLETPGDRIVEQAGAITIHKQQKGESKSIPDYDFVPYP